VPILVKIDEEMRPYESAHRRNDRRKPVLWATLFHQQVIEKEKKQN